MPGKNENRRSRGTHGILIGRQYVYGGTCRTTTPGWEPRRGDAELTVHLSSARAQSAVASLAEPHREPITRWWHQSIQGTTIHSALVRSHGFTGSYSSVRRFLARLKAAHPQVTTVVELQPGEAAQVDFGKGPEILDPHTGDLLITRIFVITLAQSRHAYANVVSDQKVANLARIRAHANTKPTPEQATQKARGKQPPLQRPQRLAPEPGDRHAYATL